MKDLKGNEISPPRQNESIGEFPPNTSDAVAKRLGFATKTPTKRNKGKTENDKLDNENFLIPEEREKTIHTESVNNGILLNTTSESKNKANSNKSMEKSEKNEGNFSIVNHKHIDNEHANEVKQTCSATSSSCIENPMKAVTIMENGILFQPTTHNRQPKRISMVTNNMCRLKNIETSNETVDTLHLTAEVRVCLLNR